MDWTTFFFATYEIVLSIIFSLLTIFITQLFLNNTLLNTKIPGNDYSKNLSIAIFAGSIIISVLLLVNSSILPAVDTLRTMVLASEKFTFRMIGVSLLYFLLFFMITLFFSILIMWLAIKVYFKATLNLDEMEELRNKNMAVSVMMSMVVLGIALFVRPSLSRFISSLVHYEKLETITSPDVEEQPADEGELIVPLKKIEPKK
jgi:hypothetical protein